jgi:hypothetical protein
MAKKRRPEYRFSSRPLYSKADLATIARAAGLTKFPAEHVKDLQDVAARYRLAQWMQAEGLPPRCEIRELLEQLAEAARTGTDAALTDAWANLPYPAVKLLYAEAPPLLDIAGQSASVTEYRDEMRRDLGEAATRAAAKVPPGAEPTRARLAFVQAIAPLFVELTGLEPTRRTRSVNGPSVAYGPFLEFVRAALHPIDPALVPGVEADIAKLRRQAR